MYSPILAGEAAQYKSTEKGVSRMCRIMEEMIDEGRQKGREEGRREGLLDNVKRLMANGSLSLEKAMELLGIQVDVRQFVVEHLGK